MVSVNVRELLLHLNHFSTRALQAAVGLSVSRTHYEVTLEHLFLSFLDDSQADWRLLFRQYELEPAHLQQIITRQLEDSPTGNTSKPVLSPHLIQLVQDAWMVASIELHEPTIRSGAILSAFLYKPSAYSSGKYIAQLEQINREELLKNFHPILKTSSETESLAEPTTRSAEQAAARADGGFIDRFCNDFTQKAREGKIDPVLGRDSEIRKIIDILVRRRKNNPICVGEPGVGKTAVVEGLALRIVQGDVPEQLSKMRLLGLDMGMLEAGAGVRGEFERRLKGVIDEVKASEQPIILFIDEAHTLVGGSSGSSDAANLLKPALARGELRTIAATTWREYKKYFEKDAALERRFQPVKLDEPSVEDTILILRGIKEIYEAVHQVTVRDDAVVAAAELSDRYISGRFLPDKAIDLLDTSCARIKINLSAKPAALEDKERKIQAYQRQIAAWERDRANGMNIEETQLKAIHQAIGTTAEEAEVIRERWQKEKALVERIISLRQSLHQTEQKKQRQQLQRQMNAAARELEKLQGGDGMVQIEVTPEVVARVVSDWTGVPLGKLQKDEAKTVVDLEAILKRRIKGQDQALQIIAEIIRAAKAGIKNPNQPLGVFLLVGPSGVGKTETGLALADTLFGSEKNVVTINMSEFQESHTISRLIGSPPGYVGFGEGGMLTEAIRQKPYSVVLLDEVEKAHLDVMNLFYQVFDKGILTDGEGKEINFKNTIIILTSNLASDIIQEMSLAGVAIPTESILSAIRPLLAQHFKPALLARMTVVPYLSLKPEAMKEIVELKLKQVQEIVRNNNKMELHYSPEVLNQIVARCTEVETGARTIDYILNTNILPRLSRSILSRLSEKTAPQVVRVSVDQDGSFRIDFE
ncbi:MAG: type VI secretion system ATPase TssH [bacterium]